jgi:hypothetical protein
MPWNDNPRWAVLRTLERAMEKVAHGAPTLRAALYLERLSDKEWSEVDRAIDDVRFEPGPAPFPMAPLFRPGESERISAFRDALRTAEKNSWIHWEDETSGWSRARCVAALFCAIERVRSMPAASPGPLFDQQQRRGP